MILEQYRQEFPAVCLLLLCLWVAANSEVCSEGELCSANEFKHRSSIDVDVFGQSNELSLMQLSTIEKRAQTKNDASEETPKDTSESTPKGQLQTKVAVCIAGQLSRLEISSKIENVLKPLAGDHLVHVFLALEDGEGGYVNKVTAGTCEPQLTDNVVKALQPFYQAGSFHPHYDYRPNISHWSRSNYLTAKPHTNNTKRLAMHMSQTSNLKKCADLITTHESLLGIQYDLVLKLRDNTIAVQPFVLPSSTDPAVQVKECCSWGGISDKVLLAPRKHLHPSLTGMYSVLMGVEQGDPDMTVAFAEDKSMRNAESLLKKVLQFHKVPVREVSATVLPFVDARCDSIDGKRVWCPVATDKDCRPPSPWNFHMSEDCKTEDLSKGCK